MYWNQKSKYVLAFSKVKYLIFPLFFMCFSKENRNLQGISEDTRNRNENWMNLDATFLKCKVLVRWWDTTEKERETEKKHRDIK